MASICSYKGELPVKGQWLLPALQWEKAAPPALTLEPENSVPPHMPLMLFKLLPQCWSSEQVSLSASKPIHRPFKKNFWNFRNLLSHSAIISTVFHSQKL